MTLPTSIAHSDFGEPECSGCLTAEVRDDLAVISCNECGAVVRTVRASELQHTLDEIESKLDPAIAICRHCGAVIHQSVRLIAFVCDWCGKANEVA
jgi:predicted RNA-binding Zn-ribbon protein involved in translation (DUF1610 family)